MVLINLEARSNILFPLGICLFWWTIQVPEDTCRQGVFLSTSIYTAFGFGLSALKRAYSKLSAINFKGIVNCGSSAPSHLVLGILRDLEQIFGILLKHFDFNIILHDFDVGLVRTVRYPKRSYSPLPNFLTNLESRSNLFFPLGVSAGGPYESPRTLDAKEYFYDILRLALVYLHILMNTIA